MNTQPAFSILLSPEMWKYRTRSRGEFAQFVLSRGGTVVQNKNVEIPYTIVGLLCEFAQFFSF